MNCPNDIAPLPRTDANEDRILGLGAEFTALLTAYFYLTPDHNDPSEHFVQTDIVDKMATLSDEIDGAAPRSPGVFAARIVSAAWQTGIEELFPESCLAETSARWRGLRALVAEARRCIAASGLAPTDAKGSSGGFTPK